MSASRTIRAVEPAHLQRWLNNSLRLLGPETSTLIALFGGDRLAAVADGGAVFVSDATGGVLAVASWSPVGEHGCPSIVGLWTAPAHRRRGHARTAFVAAVGELIDRLGADTRIRVDCASQDGRSFIERLPAEVLASLDIR